MVPDRVDEITAWYSALQSLSASDHESSMEQKIHHTQVMSGQIVGQLNKLQEQLEQQPAQANKAASLQARVKSLQRLLKRILHTKHMCP